jgi:hypothetical protein
MKYSSSLPPSGMGSLAMSLRIWNMPYSGLSTLPAMSATT